MDARRAMRAASAAIRSMDAYAALSRAERSRAERGAPPLACSAPLIEAVQGCERDVERAEELIGRFSGRNADKRGGEALRLHYIGLMGWREVAEAMGLSESGARTAARVALAWLDSDGRDGAG